jgi:hypothetical protein
VSDSTRRPPTISSVQHANEAERSLGAFLLVIFAMVREELGAVLPGTGVISLALNYTTGY